IYINIYLIIVPLCLILLFWKREKLSLIEKRRVEKIDMAEEAWIDDPVYVAVNKDAGESRSTLTWALRHLQFNKLFLLHVHLPISMNPTSSGLEQSEIDAIQVSELTSTYESLLKYRDICLHEGVNEQDVEIFCDVGNNVEEGIVNLIYENNIKKLIIGAAADSRYSEGMVNITSRKAKYVSSHAPHCCKIWLVCNGNLIQTREGRFDLEGSSHSSSESLASLHDLDSALIPFEDVVRAEPDSESHALSSPEDQSARGSAATYYEEQRRRLEIEELERELEQHDKMNREREEALSSSFGVTQMLYSEEVRRRREAEEELNRARAEIKDMKSVQKELEEQLYIDCPRRLDMVEKERDEAIKKTEELLRNLYLEKGESSSHSTSSSSQWSVSNEPPPYFICPISKEIMQNPHVAADGYTYEADEFKNWLVHGGEKSPMTNLKLVNHNLTPNLALRSAINEWLQQHPYFFDLP
ncbi:PREDICTED: U-box domain-containing protein 56, partial [Brassica oleracea var. oleracea]